MCFSGKKRLPSEWCLCVGNEYKHAEDEQIASKGTHRKKSIREVIAKIKNLFVRMHNNGSHMEIELKDSWKKGFD